MCRDGARIGPVCVGTPGCRASYCYLASQDGARLAARHLVRRIERRKVLSAHFPGNVAFDPLRAAVPAYDTRVRIQHEDGVVLYRVDQLPEMDVAQRMREGLAC